jgi:capsular polysaccharide biosynthesis protein
MEQCVDFSGKRPWKVEKLMYASPVSMTGDHEAGSLNWMRARILQGCLGRSEVPPGTRRLYVSRRRAACRRVVNEAGILPLLKKNGFEIIEGEALGFEEQVRLFSEAAVVAGPHGGGLTNAVWCAAGTRLFEIFEPGSVRRCYWSLARARGLNYACAVGREVNNPGGEPDLEFAREEFEAALERVIAPAKTP